MTIRLLPSHNHIRLSPLFHTITGCKEVPAEELLERAEAHSYKQGAHQAEENIKNNTMYVGATL